MVDFVKQLAVYYGPRVKRLKKAVHEVRSYGNYVFVGKGKIEKIKSFYDLEFDYQNKLKKYGKEELIAKRIKVFKDDFLKTEIKSDKDIIIYKYAREDFNRIKDVIYNSSIPNKDEYINKLKRTILYRLNNIHEYVTVTRYKDYYNKKNDLDFYKIIVSDFKIVYCVHNNRKIIIGIFYKKRFTDDHFTLISPNHRKRMTKLRIKGDRIFLKDYCRIITLLYLENLSENIEKDRDEYLKKHIVRKYNTDRYIVQEIPKVKKLTKKDKERRKRIVKEKKKEIYEYYKNHIMER